MAGRTHRVTMREIRTSGSEGGPNPIGSPYPYHFVYVLKDVGHQYVL